jgi:hypothetical protein
VAEPGEPRWWVALQPRSDLFYSKTILPSNSQPRYNLGRTWSESLRFPIIDSYMQCDTDLLERRRCFINDRRGKQSSSDQLFRNSSYQSARIVQEREKSSDVPNEIVGSALEKQGCCPPCAPRSPITMLYISSSHALASLLPDWNRNKVTELWK